MKNEELVGKQYPKDKRLDKSGFLAAARLHQSNFRLNELNLNEYDRYGNYLTRSDAQQGYNFFDGLGIFEALNAENKSAYNANIYANMLRSEHIPYNLFIPLDCDKEFAKSVSQRYNTKC